MKTVWKTPCVIYIDLSHRCWMLLLPPRRAESYSICIAQVVGILEGLQGVFFIIFPLFSRPKHLPRGENILKHLWSMITQIGKHGGWCEKLAIQRCKGVQHTDQYPSVSHFLLAVHTPQRSSPVYFKIPAHLTLIQALLTFLGLFTLTPVMYQHDSSEKPDESLKQSSFEDDVDSEQLLLEHEFYGTAPSRRMTLRKCIPPLSTTMTFLFLSLSLGIFVLTFVARDLDRACLKRMTGWCKYNKSDLEYRSSINWNWQNKITAPLLEVIGHRYQYLDPDLPSEFTGEWTEESAVAWNDMWHCMDKLFSYPDLFWIQNEIELMHLRWCNGHFRR